ncbi:hypothetical protein Bca52824_073785 [Brassica carinata]|uniref:Uncharacterized protein n=1 Tax=Brassica carinata TaxID=52824 RepID=A0A8X7U8B7_BRACI|nr:hypothetical protein Bca52824_073785 [Brassica carinata]
MEPCHGEVGLSSSSFGSSSSFVPNLSSVVPNMPSVMETSELSSLIGMSSDGKVACTLTGSEAEDRVSMSLIEEGTGFHFDEHGTNLAVEPGVEGARLSLTTPLVVPSSSSLVKKTMLETVREHEQMRLANSSQTKESSSETTSSSDDSSYSSSHSEKSVDSADVAGEYDNISEDDKRDDDVENGYVEDDGALGSADDKWNGTCDVNVGEESDQDEYASDGDHAAVGDDEMGDRDGVDGRSDFSGECDDFSDEQDSFSGEQSGVSGSLGVIVVDDGRDDTDGGSDRRADVTDILRKIKQESVAASLARSLDALGRHLVGVPLAPGDSECVEYFKETKARDWTVVRRSEVWRRIPFIDSACWRKMDLSEIPSLVDCFAGGIDDASVVESGQCAAGVDPSASARSIVIGLMSKTVPVPSADVSGKEVVVAGSGSVVAKRAAAGRSPKDVPPLKSRKIVNSDVELPLVVESPAAEKASFESFEHSFNGLASECGDLFKLFQSPGGVDGLPFDQATKFANKLVVNQDEELEEVKAELEKTKAELASIKDKADGSEEIAALHGKYEAEKKVSSDALEEVEKLTAKIALEAGRVKKRQAADLERFKKEKEVAGRRYRRAVTRHDDVLATFNSRIEKVRRYVENQKVVRIAMHGVNQIMGVLDAAKTWKKEAIIIPDGKVKHLENELVRRKEKANLVVRVEFEPKELADIPSFDFTRPLSPAHPSLTAGVEDAAKARGKEENHRREEASRRRVADRAGAVSSAVRREGQTLAVMI